MQSFSLSAIVWFQSPSVRKWLIRCLNLTPQFRVKQAASHASYQVSSQHLEPSKGRFLTVLLSPSHAEFSSTQSFLVLATFTTQDGRQILCYILTTNIKGFRASWSSWEKLYSGMKVACTKGMRKLKLYLSKQTQCYEYYGVLKLRLPSEQPAFSWFSRFPPKQRF